MLTVASPALRSRPELELAAEQVENLFRFAAHPVEHLNNWFIQPRDSWNLDDYLRGELWLCAEIRRHGFGKFKPQKFYAIFSNADRAGRLLDAADNDISVLVAFALRESRGPDREIRSHYGPPSNDQQQTMLVDIVHPMDGPKRTLGGVFSATHVRLFRDNLVMRGGGDSLYRSAFNGLFEFFGVDANWKVRVPIGPPFSAPFDHGVDKVIERSPKLMDDLTDENANTNWDIQIAATSDNVVGIVFFELTRDYIRGWVGAQEGRDVKIDLLDCFVGPLNLCADTIK